MSDAEITPVPPANTWFIDEDRIRRWRPVIEGVWVDARNPDGSCTLTCCFSSPGHNSICLTAEQAKFLASQLYDMTATPEVAERESLAQAMRHIRTSILQVSQADFANIACCQQATVSRWEAGILQPSLTHLHRIRNEVVNRGHPWDDALFFAPPVETQPPHQEAAA